MQYTEIFFDCKNENFHWKKFDIFLIFAQNIDCGYTLEPPQRGGSNEYPQSMFWSKNKKNRYTPAYPSFAIKQWGLRGYTLHGHVILMVRYTLLNKHNLGRTVALQGGIFARDKQGLGDDWKLEISDFKFIR